MKKLSEFLKLSAIRAMSFSIIFSFCFYTLPITQVMAASDKAEQKAIEAEQAALKEKCKQHEAGGVYSPECEFNKAVEVVNEDVTEGMKGAVEQFLGMAFASAAFSALKYSRDQISAANCPQNNNAKYTLKLMQAGAVAYIIGELKARDGLRKASKVTLDESFEKDTTTTEAQKDHSYQLASYDALMKVYDHKIKGMETKRNLSNVASLAYLGALGTELYLTRNLKAICIKAWAQDKANKSLLKSEETQVGLKVDNALLQATSSLPLTAGLAASCKIARTSLTTESAADTEVEGKGRITRALKKTKNIGKSAVELQLLGGILGFGASIVTGKADGKSLGAAVLAKKLLMSKTSLGDIAKTGQTAGQEATALNIELSKDQAIDSQAATAVAACTLNPADVKPPFLAEVKKENSPMYCCGSELGVIPNGLAASLGRVPDAKEGGGVVDLVRDIVFNVPKKNSGGGSGGNNRGFPIPGFRISPIEQDLTFLKPAIINAIEDMYFAKLDLKNLEPQVAMKKLRAMYQYIDYIDANFETEIMHSPEVHNFKKEMAKMDMSNPATFRDKLASMKFEIINSAQAVSVMDLLSFGIKMYSMHSLIGDFYKHVALIKPRNRMWTYATMGTMQKVISNFQEEAIVEHQNYRKSVEEQKQKFKESHNLEGGVNEGTDGVAGAAGVAEESGIEPTGTLIPPNTGEASLIADGSKYSSNPNDYLPNGGNNFNPPTQRELQKAGVADGALNNLPNVLRDSTASFASGRGVGGTANNTKGGSLAKLQSAQRAARKSVDALIKAQDKSDKNLKGSDGKGLEPLSRSIAKINSKFRGTPTNSAISTGAGLAGAASGEDAKDKAKKEAGPIEVNPIASGFNGYSAGQGGGFNFDSGSNNGSGQYSNLGEGAPEPIEEFALNTGEIMEDDGVSVFQAISNRYLRSYPVLLDRVDKKE